MNYAANIPRFYLYKALRFPLLWLPIYVVFFQDERGLSLAHIGIIDAVFWLATALGEVPTGAVADRFGRKTSMLIGTTLYTFSIACIAFVESFPLILLAYIGWGIALTLTSGADEALLYESLKADGRTDAYTGIFARVETIQITARAFGSLAGGLLAGIMLSLPFAMSALLGVLSFFVILSMREPAPTEGEKRAPYKTIMHDSMQLIRNRPVVRWALFYLAVVPLAPFIIFFVYIQPYALDTGLQVASLGFLVAAVNIVSVLGALLAPTLTRRFGEIPVLLVIPMVLLMGLVALTFTVSWHGLVLIGGLIFVMAIIRPVVMTIIQREVSDSVRATIVSLGSLVFTLLLAIVSPIYGWIADTYGTNAVFAGMSMTLAASMLFALTMRPPRFVTRLSAYIRKLP